MAGSRRQLNANFIVGGTAEETFARCDNLITVHLPKDRVGTKNLSPDHSPAYPNAARRKA